MLVAFAPGAMAAPVSHFRDQQRLALTEGDAGTTNLTFTISYTGTKNNISVDWATANGTATAGADYVASSGTATFTLAGATSQTINIPIIGDLLDEANETFTVNLSNPTAGRDRRHHDPHRHRDDQRQRPHALARHQRRVADRGQRRDDERRTSPSRSPPRAGATSR